MSIKESALSIVQSIADSDYLRAVTSLGASRRVQASNVGKYVVETYEGSELGGESQSVKEVIDSMNTTLATLDNKANVDGTYPLLTAGDAEQVLSTDMITDNEPYTFRQTAGGAKVGNRLFDTLVGGSVAWNQLAYDPTFTNASNWDARYGTVSVNNNIATVTPTSNGTVRGLIMATAHASSATRNHKYFLGLDVLSPITSTVSLTFQGVGGTPTDVTANTWKRCEAIYVSTDATTTRLAAYINGSVTTSQTIQYKNAIAVDLTAMYGSTIADYIYTLEQGTAGAGVAFFRKYFPNMDAEYTYLDTDGETEITKKLRDYQQGVILSVEGVSAHNTVGFNQWDEEWEQYGSSQIKSKNAIRVFPNTTYYVKAPTGVNIYFKETPTGASFDNWGGSNGTFTTPSNCYYIMLYTGAGYGTSYNHDICINISDLTKNGTYEPYKENTYPLDDSLTLRGIPKIANGKLYYDGDTYRSDGLHTELYDIYDCGTKTTATLSMQKNNQNADDWLYYISNAPNINTHLASNADNKTLIMAEHFVASSSAPTYQNGGLISYEPQYGGIIYLNFYGLISTNDVATAKAYLINNGIKILYRIEPSESSAEPFASPQIPYSGGTEEYVTTGIVPVGHDSQYSKDLRAKLEALPDDLSMIAPVEKGYTATQNYAIGSYLIVNNTFYKVTSAIANGGTITPNTNVTATTVATELIALR